MAIVGTRVIVTTSPTPLVPLSTGLPSRASGDPWPSEIRWISGTTTVDLGGSEVVTGEGFPIYSTDPPFGFDIDFNDQLYGVVATGTAVVAVLIGRQ